MSLSLSLSSTLTFSSTSYYSLHCKHVTYRFLFLFPASVRLDCCFGRELFEKKWYHLYCSVNCIQSVISTFELPACNSSHCLFVIQINLFEYYNSQACVTSCSLFISHVNSRVFVFLLNCFILCIHLSNTFQLHWISVSFSHVTSFVFSLFLFHVVVISFCQKVLHVF